MRRDGASPKELEKAEAKLKKAHDEYRSLVDKYNNIREEFEKRMTTSCKVRAIIFCMINYGMFIFLLKLSEVQ